MSDRPRGRPALARGERSAYISVSLPPDLFDRVFSQARAERVTMPALIRRMIALFYEHKKSTTSPDSSSL